MRSFVLEGRRSRSTDPKQNFTSGLVACSLRRGKMCQPAENKYEKIPGA